MELILTRAIDSLGANGVTPDRDMWLKQAEEVRSGGSFNSEDGYDNHCELLFRYTWMTTSGLLLLFITYKYL